MLTHRIDLNQVWVQVSDSVQEFGPNQRIKIHIHFPTMKCDYPK